MHIIIHIYIHTHNVVMYAQECNILNPSQHRFLANTSTSSQLLECMYDWCSAVESEHVTDAVYIDFKKAFDYVPHVKLKEKLLSFKYCQLIVGWITEFQAHRTQRVRVNYALSIAASMTSGIVQGSVPGPAFVLSMNDLPEACSRVNVKLYADDVKVYKMITCPADRTCLQQILNCIENWSRD